MIPGLANHVWQSTLFAVAIGLATWMLRTNRAALRHALWMAASIKFLVPFSLLVGFGSQVRWRTAPAVPRPRLEMVQRIGGPFSPLSPPPLAPQAASWFPIAMSGIWLCGFMANTASWRRRWCKIRAAVHAASPMPLKLGILAVSGSTLVEPGVFGIIRPVLILPHGIRERLTPAQFDSVVAHELCHVRRRDNLLFAIHMMVECLFWFHPLVWWMERRLIEEREQACDEEVLRLGSDPQDYAEAILAVCGFYVPSPAVCVSGVTGASLKRRVESIMMNRVPTQTTMFRRLMLTLGGLFAVLGPVAIGLIHAPRMEAQQPPAPIGQLAAASTLPEFEAASIKPSAPDASLKIAFARGGKLFVSNATLRFLIKIAYDIGDDQLAGGPAWISSKRFDVEATPGTPEGGDPDTMSSDQLILFHKPARLRLQRLLAERFQLALRKESTPMPVFALVAAKGGPKKLAATKSTGNPQLNGKSGSGVLVATGVDMATLAKFLSEGQTGRPVLDMTGIQGKYDFRLEWSPDPNLNRGPVDTANATPDPGGVSIFTALQQQLGLKLEARTAPADRLVVVKAELPSAN